MNCRFGLRVAAVATVVAALVCLKSVPSAAGDEGDKNKKAGSGQFEQLLKLPGDWTGTASHGEGAAMPTTVTYKLTANGSAVMETLFCNTAHEMVTMYHRNGEDVLLTHYCAAGNQPRMKAVRSAAAGKLEFKFQDGTNMDPAKDPHMHEAVIEFVDDDHIKSEWSFYINGQKSSTARFDLKRKK